MATAGQIAKADDGSRTGESSCPTCQTNHGRRFDGSSRSLVGPDLQSSSKAHPDGNLPFGPGFCSRWVFLHEDRIGGNGDAGVALDSAAVVDVGSEDSVPR